MPRAERPASAEACAELLRACAGERQTVRVRGGGTKDHQGPRRDTDVVLETGALDGVVDHVPEDLTVTVLAGTAVAALRESLRAHGQFLPLDPPHVDRGATVGGIIAANSDGFGRYRYGGVRDLLLGVRAALPDGSVARAGGRVVKNVAGYDLNKLFIGSLGTLGVIVEATFKILPMPPVTRAASATFESAAEAFAAADMIVRTSLRPIATVVDRTAERRWRLVLAAAGEAAPVQRALTELARVARARGVTPEAHDDVEQLLGPLRELVDQTTTRGSVVRVALPLSAQAAFAESAVRSDRDARIVADAASGIALVQLREEAAVDGLLAGARVLGGTARIERTTLDRSTRDAAGSEPPGAFLMRRLKDAFDPQGILEPGRSVLG